MPRFFLQLSFFFNDTATTEIYTLSLHDALPISLRRDVPVPEHREPRSDQRGGCECPGEHHQSCRHGYARIEDRKSTRLNSSHSQISYAVFCLKKKKRTATRTTRQTSSRRRTESS